MTQSAKILVVDDDIQMQIAVSACLQRSGHQITVAGDGKAALALLQQEAFDLVVSDQRMPEMSGQELLQSMQQKGIRSPFIMITAHGTISQAVEAMQLGAADFISKPFSGEELERIVQRVLALPSGEGDLSECSISRPIISNDPIMIRTLEVAEAVARSDATVLVQGESGTGKELIARLIHGSSPRRSQPFVAVNCAALPSTLLESELFGHEKGAFTGAQARKIGKFEMAHGGTILLDEISEMELLLQAKLLRVLQEREVDRVGGRDPISIDVRVIATTNRNLEEAVRHGRFRADLYYRLNVIPITLPSLRDRRGDVKLLAEHFMRQHLGSAKSIPSEVLAQLEAYHWPGNVRELQNAVERAAILSRGGAIRAADFLPAGGRIEPRRLADQIEVITGAAAEPVESNPSPLMIRSGVTVHEMEKALILETLKATNNNRSNAAKLLGISVRTLRNKLHEYKVQDTDEA
ncbi:MAG: sigma-54-dependent Fis family transcriptional regulator [Deltaproteobacteria bacterium]|nr:sigma-54-dependent Fis family transcriptional regulator [Deltaproteobacteria bacterium]